MVNKDNLKPILSSEEARRRGSKGGKASVKARAEKKTVRKILNELLALQAGDVKQFEKLAKLLGVENDKSIKEVYAIVCILNSVKKANMSDLEKLVKILGEDKENENVEVMEKLDEVIKGIDSLAK